jgi:hypothetical protein
MDAGIPKKTAADEKVGAGYENLGKVSSQSKVLGRTRAGTPIKSNEPNPDDIAAARAARAAMDKQQGEDFAKQFSFKPGKNPNRSYNKGGKVKKYAEGGTATTKPEAPRPEPKKDSMPEWAKNERENKARDERNKREGKGAEQEIKRNMSTFGLKKGGSVSSASKRADGCAIRGKTRGKVY